MSIYWVSGIAEHIILSPTAFRRKNPIATPNYQYGIACILSSKKNTPTLNSVMGEGCDEQCAGGQDAAASEGEEVDP